MKKCKWFYATFITLACAAVSASGQTRSTASSAPVFEQAMAALMKVRRIGAVAISPDGARVAWVESLPGKDGAPSPNTAIYVQELQSSAMPRRITAGNGVAAFAEHGLAWSPDSRRLAFLSDKDEPGQLQLYVAELPGGAAKRLTRLAGFLDEPRWSPDGRLLAFLFTENSTRASGPLQPAALDAGVVEEHIFEQRLAILNPAAGVVRQISPADLYVYEYDWSPDASRFVAIAAHGSGDNNWFIAELYTIAATTGQTNSILKPAMQIAEPHWSPDGKTIAFIGGLMSDAGYSGGDIFTVSATGQALRNVTPGIKASPSWLTWIAGGDQILFGEHIAGSNGIAVVELASGKIDPIWVGPEAISRGGEGSVSLSLARDNKTSAIIRQSFEHPPEVWAGQTGAWRQITKLNSGLQASWGPTKSVEWQNEGLSIQGWLLYPHNFNPARRYPMVVVLHGGPAGQATPRWSGGLGSPLPLATQGYFLFFPNARGSYGQGAAFTRANVKDFGYGDFRDILAGVDEVVRKFPVDANRLGITGWSYGGYMTMWAVTQTGRFRAAVAGAGLANWQSYYGENQIDQWMIPYFGASVYDDPAIYARSSPINFVKNVKTPTLIMVGDRDAECPTPQSYEFWHALKTLGVKTQLVVYPNEGHGISQPEHRRDILRRASAWFDQHLQ